MKIHQVLIIILGVFVVAFFMKASIPVNDYEIKELTPSQLDKLIQGGMILVYKDLPKNTNDIDAGLSYDTVIGNCDIYRDIFGRYYCRW